MKVLITGHKGFIGQNFYNFAKSQNWQIVTFDIKDDVNVRPSSINLDNCDWVIHLGALSSTTETDIKKVMDLNLIWSIELFEECVKQNVNFQWASSASVYGLREISDGPMKVGDICKPANLYARSKYLLEKYITGREVDIVAQGFRYFNVYGQYEDHKGSQASPFYQFEKQAKETGIIRVFDGSENFKRDFIHVDLLIKKQLEKIKLLESGIYNIGTGMSRSFMDVANDIALMYNAKIEIIPMPENIKLHYQKYTCAG